VVFRKREAVKPLVDALADDDQFVRREIVKALGLANDSQVKDYLILSLTDKDNGVRQNAVKALGNIGGKDIVPHIINIMGDINNEVKKKAVIVLVNLRDSAAIPHLINVLDNGENPEARKQAAMSLGAFKDKKVVEVLLKMAKTEVKDLSVRLTAITSLCKIEGDLEPEIFSDLLDDSNYEIRKIAVRCLGIFKNKKMINILINKLSDKDKDVRREAVLALGRYKDNRVFDALVNVLLNTDEDGANLTRLTSTPYDEKDPSWSSDRQKIVYATSDGQLNIIDVNTKEHQQLDIQDKSSAKTSPSFSPDGKKIAFVEVVSGGTDDTDIMMFSLGKKAGKVFLNQYGPQFQPDWSPDGQHLIYASAHCAVVCGRIIQELWIADASGDYARQLLMTNSLCQQPAWSPEGNKLAFISTKTGRMEI